MDRETGFRLEVISVNDRGLPPERVCRAGHSLGQRWNLGWNTPEGLCGEVYVSIYPLLFALRTGGDVRRLGSSSPGQRIYTCPSRVVTFLLSVERENPDSIDRKERLSCGTSRE